MEVDQLWALIPARGGSKSIPLKNMKLLNGHPLIKYSIKAARSSSSVERLFCSTDSEEIANYVGEQEAEVVVRPPELAQDGSPTIDAVLHWIEYLQKKEAAVPKAVALLEATSPFLLAEHIDFAYELFRSDQTLTSVQTLCEMPPNHHAFNQREIVDGKSVFCFPEERKFSINKQTKPKYFVHGNLRIMSTRNLIDKHNLFGDNSAAIIVPRHYGLDVDSYDDFQIAEAYLANKLVSLSW
ncbi:acylneuraminate cytidylyltransferase family protein [Gammaproteobacteria bacterium]|nr:acylneuraminate cytidylyltransferase family protein [Gammaproteobacteria bacterium]